MNSTSFTNVLLHWKVTWNVSDREECLKNKTKKTKRKSNKMSECTDSKRNERINKV